MAAIRDIAITFSISLIVEGLLAYYSIEDQSSSVQMTVVLCEDGYHIVVE